MLNDELLRSVATVLVAVVTAVGGAGFATSRTQRKHLGAESDRQEAEGRRADAAAQVALSDAAIRLLKPYKENAAELQVQIADLKKENHQQALKILALERHARAIQQYIVTHYPDDKGAPQL